ncbi:hypothetical protein [Alkalimarinus coralli]|uniref:hypothetical protein n=1 Tax=Alkalimarinus coralli TaxID=2935863 RepID=UPI00202ACCEF|nr:hypothetical protein [Alkalimarinus coralli]
MSEVSEYGGVSYEDTRKIKAIIRSFYGEETAVRFTTSSISDETVHRIAILLSETVDCSQWMDAVPNPEDIIRPTKSLQKWALRLIREAGEPFLQGAEGVTIACKNFRAAQFKTDILFSLKY